MLNCGCACLRYLHLLFDPIRSRRISLPGRSLQPPGTSNCLKYSSHNLPTDSTSLRVIWGLRQRLHHGLIKADNFRHLKQVGKLSPTILILRSKRCLCFWFGRDFKNLVKNIMQIRHLNQFYLFFSNIIDVFF